MNETGTGDGGGQAGLRDDQILLLSPFDLAHHRPQIEATADKAADLMIEVGHRHCGDASCSRPDGKVKILVTWLDGPDDPDDPDRAGSTPGSTPGFSAGSDLTYRADIQDEGFQVCAQVVRRLRQRIGQLYAERRRSRNRRP